MTLNDYNWSSYQNFVGGKASMKLTTPCNATLDGQPLNVTMDCVVESDDEDGDDVVLNQLPARFMPSFIIEASVLPPDEVSVGTRIEWKFKAKDIKSQEYVKGQLSVVAFWNDDDDSYMIHGIEDNPSPDGEQSIALTIEELDFGPGYVLLQIREAFPEKPDHFLRWSHKVKVS